MVFMRRHVAATRQGFNCLWRRLNILMLPGSEEDEYSQSYDSDSKLNSLVPWLKIDILKFLCQFVQLLASRGYPVTKPV